MANIEIEKFLGNCLDVIEKGHKFISAERDCFQLKSDIDSGYMRKNGVLLDSKTGIRKFAFENYELFVLRGYILLARNVLNNTGSPFTPFCFRTLHEIGVQKIDVLFAKGVSENNRNRFRLENILSDWLELSSQSDYSENFLNLFAEKQTILDADIKKLFREADKTLRSSKKVELSLIKKIKRKLNRNIKEYTKGVEIFPFLQKSNLNFLSTAWSHLLHGNPFHIEATFSLDADKFKNRTYAILCLTVVNILHRINDQIEDPSLQKEIESLLRQAYLIWDKLIADWKRSKVSNE